MWTAQGEGGAGAAKGPERWVRVVVSSGAGVHCRCEDGGGRGGRLGMQGAAAGGSAGDSETHETWLRLSPWVAPGLWGHPPLS